MGACEKNRSSAGSTEHVVKFLFKGQTVWELLGQAGRPCCSYVHERAVEVLSEVHILTRRIGNLQIWRQEHLKSLHRLRSQATREANTLGP
eukprot:356553-Amphidinium_carterae.1